MVFMETFSNLPSINGMLNTYKKKWYVEYLELGGGSVALVDFKRCA